MDDLHHVQEEGCAVHYLACWVFKLVQISNRTSWVSEGPFIWCSCMIERTRGLFLTQHRKQCLTLLHKWKQNNINSYLWPHPSTLSQSFFFMHIFVNVFSPELTDEIISPLSWAAWASANLTVGCFLWFSSCSCLVKCVSYRITLSPSIWSGVVFLFPWIIQSAVLWFHVDIPNSR